MCAGGNELLPAGLPPAFYHKFIGCISRVEADDRPLHFVHDSRMLFTDIVHYCDENVIR